MTDSTSTTSNQKPNDDCKLSLLNPDLSGLYAVARLGTNRTWWSIALGWIVMIIFIYSWILGFFLPVIGLFLLYFRYYTTSISIFTILFIPYLIPIQDKTRAAVCRFYMYYGAHYFQGGTSMNVEFEPRCLKKSNKIDDIPIIIAVHPHGIFCIGFFLCGGIRMQACFDSNNDKYKQTYCGKWSVISSKFNNKMPRFGLSVGYLLKAPLFSFFLVKATGCIQSADAKDLKKTMINRKPFGIVTGGFNEATIFEKNENVIYIKKRKGLIKYCLQYGPYEIQPSYIFGECNTYNNLVSVLSKIFCLNKNIKATLNRYKIPTTFPIGPLWFIPFLGLLPYNNCALHNIIGKSIVIPKIENPTQEDIDHYHKWYVNEIVRIFETNKWRFGLDDKILKVK